MISSRISTALSPTLNDSEFFLTGGLWRMLHCGKHLREMCFPQCLDNSSREIGVTHIHHKATTKDAFCLSFFMETDFIDVVAGIKNIS